MSTRFALLFLLAMQCAEAGTVDIVFLDSFESGCGNLVHSEAFALGDGSSWPAPWTELGNVDAADIQQQRSRLRPGTTSYSLARMGSPVATGNVELRFTLRLEDATTQGVGFYVRQNGGYLTQTVPQGQGYAVFAETNFRGLPGVGVWKEVNGNEIEIAHAPNMVLVPNVEYRVRYQVLQASPTETLSRASLWLNGNQEPGNWQVSAIDSTPVLQNIVDGIAIDSWSNVTAGPITAYTHVDNIELISLCVP